MPMSKAEEADRAGLPREVALSVALPLENPRGAAMLDADHLRRGLLRLVEKAWGQPSARQLHDDPGAGGHPWTISPPWEDGHRVWCRISVVGAETCVRVARSLRAGERLTSGGWVIGPRSEWRARAVTLSSLLSEPRGGPVTQARVELLSPSGLAASHGRGEDPLPTPRSLFGSWRRRWLDHLAAEPGAALDDVAIRAHAQWVDRAVRIQAADLRIGRAETSGGVGITGAVGWMDLRLGEPGSREHRLGVALMRLACFSGTGRRLAFGFGQTWTWMGGRMAGGWPSVLGQHRPFAHHSSLASDRAGIGRGRSDDLDERVVSTPVARHHPSQSVGGVER